MNEYEQNQQNNPPGGEQQPPQQDWQQQPQQQQPPQQGWQQPPPQQHPPRDFFKGLASDKTLTMAIMLGLLIIMIGAILVHSATFSDSAGTINDIINVGNILKDIGVFIVAGMMLLGALYRDDWDKWMRVGMVGFALVLIVVGYFPIGLEFGATAGPGWFF